MSINAYRGLLLATLLAVVLVACGGEADEADQADGDATDETETEDGEGDAGDEDEQPDDADEGQEDAEAEEAGAEGFEWDPEASLRVTYRYEAEFHETDEPATMIVAREDGRQSMQWDQGGMRAHIYTDAQDPFVCTAEGDRGWECKRATTSPWATSSSASTSGGTRS